MFTFQALQILIFLIPGFISARILSSLIVRREGTEFSKVVEALIFSLLIYTFYSFIFSNTPIQFNTTEQSIIFSYDWKSLALLAVISIVLPAALGFLVTNDFHMILARKLRISRKTARSSVWFDVLYDIRKHIIINFKDGRRIYGWPMYYSNDPDDQYIFLYNPSWIVETDRDQDQKFIELEVEGILITPKQEIETIEFLKT